MDSSIRGQDVGTSTGYHFAFSAGQLCSTFLNMCIETDRIGQVLGVECARATNGDLASARASPEPQDRAYHPTAARVNARRAVVCHESRPSSPAVIWACP